MALPPEAGMVGIDELLAHRSFVRALARRLVADEHVAGDLEQSVWLRALRSPPRRGGSLRGWLATVTRNAHRRRHRRDAVRANAEVLAWEGRDEHPDAFEDVALAAFRADMEATLGRLAPMYREVLELRYRHELAPAEIGARLGIPVDTVYSRSRRALDQMRERLDREYGDRRAWSAVALSLAERASPGPAARPDAVAIVPGPVGLAAVLVVALSVVLATRDVRADGGAGDEVRVGRVLPASTGVVDAGADDARADAAPPRAGESARRVEPAPSSNDPEPRSAPGASPLAGSATSLALGAGGRTRVVVRGVVVEEDGTPAVGAEVRVAPPGAPARGPLGSNASSSAAGASDREDRVPDAVTDARGGYVLPGVEAGSWVTARSASGAVSTMRPVRVVPGEPSGEELVVPTLTLRRSPLAPVAGFVHDPSGAPLAGVEVRLVPDGLLPAMPDEGGAIELRYVPAPVTTDAAGRFVFAHVARGRARLFFEAPGRAPRELGIGPADVVGGLDPQRMDVALELASDGARGTDLERVQRVHGFARSADGEPLAGWTVEVERVSRQSIDPLAFGIDEHDGIVRARTDASGRYCVDLPIRLPLARAPEGSAANDDGRRVEARLFPPGWMPRDADASRIARGVAIATADPEQPLELELVARAPGAPGASLRGVLVRADGRAVANAELAWTSPALSGVVLGRTDARGGFALDGLAPSEFVAALRVEGVLRRAAVRAAVGERDVDVGVVVLPEAGSIVVECAAIRAGANVDVTWSVAAISGRDEVVRSAPLERDRIRFDGLPPGRYRVLLRRGSAAVAHRSLAVAPGGVASVAWGAADAGAVTPAPDRDR